jgi:hypothetical protein
VDRLVLTSGKMVLLDKLLTRLRETGHRSVQGLGFRTETSFLWTLWRSRDMARMAGCSLLQRHLLDTELHT